MRNTPRSIIIFVLAVAICTSSISFGDTVYTDAASSTATSKKGIQVSGPQDIYQAVELGCESVFINIRVTDLISTSNQYYGISISAGGRSYYMNQSQLQYYNSQFEYARENGIKNIYVQIYAEEFEGLTDTTDSSATYHAFDTSTTNGKKLVKSVFEKLCQYMGENVDYWIIGNEINDQHVYYEMGTTSLSTYVKYYEVAMRLMYDAAVEYNSDACVMVCLDHEWNSTAGDRFNSMELLEELASRTADDDYNWGVAIHPYPEPLTSANFWDDEDNQATNSEDTYRITMYNLSVFTDFMQNSTMKYKGSVRHIAITECGFNALSDGTEDQELQAAAYTYAYYKAEANKYIDTFIIRSYQDNSAEAAQEICFGLVDLNGDRREIYNVFRYIDTVYGSNYTDKYLSYFGVSSWSDLVSGYSNVSLTKNPFSVTLSVVDTNIINGNSVACSTSVYGFSGSLSFQYQFETDEGALLTLKDYSTSTTYTGNIEFGCSGYLIVNVTDSTGEVTTDKVYIHVTDSETYNTTGLVDVGGSLYYLDKGILDLSFTGLADYDGETYYVRYGMVDGTASGLVYTGDGSYYIENSMVVNYTGLMEYEGTIYYLVSGKLASDYCGLRESEDDGLTYYVSYGCVTGYDTGILWIDDEVYYVQNSVVVDEEIEIVEEWMILQSETLKKAIMPDTVKEIASYAFSDANKLNSVELNDGLEYIGFSAFLNCSLTCVIIPESVEYIEEYSFGYYINEYYDYEKIEDFIIYGYEGTAAETYAEDNGFTFITDESQFTSGGDDYLLGDINEDEAVDYLDAMTALRYDAELITLDETQLLVGDVNGDGCVDSLDAIMILRYDAGLITSF